MEEEYWEEKPPEEMARRLDSIEALEQEKYQEGVMAEKWLEEKQLESRTNRELNPSET